MHSIASSVKALLNILRINMNPREKEDPPYRHRYVAQPEIARDEVTNRLQPSAWLYWTIWGSVLLLSWQIRYVPYSKTWSSRPKALQASLWPVRQWWWGQAAKLQVNVILRIFCVSLRLDDVLREWPIHTKRFVKGETRPGGAGPELCCKFHQHTAWVAGYFGTWLS